MADDKGTLRSIVAKAEKITRTSPQPLPKSSPTTTAKSQMAQMMAKPTQRKK